MNSEQKKLINYWVFIIFVLLAGAYISLTDMEGKQMALFLLTIPVAVASIFQDFSYYSGYGAYRERIGEFIERHPVVKYWLVLYCLTVLPFLVYTMGTTDNDSLQGYLYFSSFILLIGPVIVFSEYERFQAMRD